MVNGESTQTSSPFTKFVHFTNPWLDPCCFFKPLAKRHKVQPCLCFPMWHVTQFLVLDIVYTISFANFYWFETWMTVFQWFKKVVYISISWNMNIQPLLTNHIILIWVMFITLFIHLVRDPSSRGFWRAIFFGTMDHYNSFKTKIELKNLLSCPRNPCCSNFMCPNHHIRAWNHTLPLFNITFS